MSNFILFTRYFLIEKEPFSLILQIFYCCKYSRFLLNKLKCLERNQFLYGQASNLQKANVFQKVVASFARIYYHIYMYIFFTWRNHINSTSRPLIFFQVNRVERAFTTPITFKTQTNCSINKLGSTHRFLQCTLQLFVLSEFTCLNARFSFTKTSLVECKVSLLLLGSEGNPLDKARWSGSYSWD